MLEHTAFRRFQVLVDAFNRLNVPDNASKYQRLHATLDEKHGVELRDIVCIGLFKEDPSIIRDIAYGIQERG